MNKIKENFKKFTTIWGIVLVINQVFIFGACFYPTCILAALPHTGIIAFFITLKLIKSETQKKTEEIKKDIVSEEIKRLLVNVGLEEILNNHEISNDNSNKQMLLEKFNSLNEKLYKLKIEKEDIIFKIEQYEYEQFTTFGSIKLKLLSLKKQNSITAKNEYATFLDFCKKYKKYKPQEKKYNIEKTKIYYINDLEEVKSKIQNIENEIQIYELDIKNLKENTKYKNILRLVNRRLTLQAEKDKILKELATLKEQNENETPKNPKPKIERKGLRIVKKATNSKSKDLTNFIDNELEKLSQELKSLESTLQELIIEKTEHLNSIDEFNTQYNLHLGELIKEILNLKKEILYKQTIKQQKAKQNYEEEIQIFQDTKETIAELKDTISQLKVALEDIDKNDENYDEIYKAYKELQDELETLEDDLKHQEEELEKTKKFIEDEEIEKEYEDVKSSYEEFENEYNHIKDEYDSKIAISDEEKNELKKLYKKAARLCHPDIVPDELKEKAHDIMQQLNEAYSIQDIKAVKNILLSLENGDGFELSSDSINDKELLKEKIQEYKNSIEDIKSELEDIKHDETYETISNLDDWDEYFEELKNKLKLEKEKLELEIKPMAKNVEKWVENLWNWAEKKENGIEILPRDVEKLINLKVIDIDILSYDDSLLYPEELLNLKNLEKLVIGYFLAEHTTSIESYYNKFFSEIINTHIKLKELGLIELEISLVPDNISNLKLEKLCLWTNKIESLPESIGDINSLKILQLSDNKLCKLPNNIINLNNLEQLDLDKNNNLVLNDKQIEWIISLEENGCKVQLDNYLRELISDYKTESIKKTQNEKIDFGDRSYTSSNSSMNYMGDGMWINDSDRWW